MALHARRVGETDFWTDGRVRLFCGDNREVLAKFRESTIDAIVTDPPYALTSIVKRFANSPRSAGNTETPYGRTGRGFMGQKWDTGEVAFDPAFWAECLRVLKPGGHMVAFGGSRGYHRMACAIEDAGFEIRDSLCWMFAVGFPKSHNLDNKRGDLICGCDDVEPRAVAGQPIVQDGRAWPDCGRCGKPMVPRGLGTALKPAFEPIVLARKPLSENTVAANVLKWRTGALNIDGCRVGVRERSWVTYPRRTSNIYGAIDSPGGKLLPAGRWPANVVHDGSDEVVGMFPNTKSGQLLPTYNAKESQNGSMSGKNYAGRIKSEFGGDSGSAARFFYSAKASKADRAGSKHPTVKPVALMQWLCRLITPPGGVILDPFAGSGTTAAAALAEGMQCILIEREDEYQADIKRRFEAA